MGAVDEEASDDDTPSDAADECRRVAMSGERADRDQVGRWFRLLYGDARGYLHVASTGNWAGRAFDLAHDGIARAIDYVGQLDEAGVGGIYSRVTTLSRRPESHARGGASLSASLPALWADVDFVGPGHKHVACPGGAGCPHVDQPNPHPNRVLPLPPTADAAYDLISRSPLPEPSLWVHSGGGLYPIWLLDPVHHVDGDLGPLAALSARWQHVIEASARGRGWHYGSGVGDLARVLRVPGTWNRKAALPEPAPCYVARGRMVRYTINELYDAYEGARDKLPPAPVTEPVPRRPPRERSLAGDVRPGDDFTARVDWSDELLLGKLGWKVTVQRGNYREWLRPDAAGTLTATTGKDGRDNLYVFSTEAPPFPAQRPISKLEAYRLLWGHADFRAAVKALNALGFGTPAFEGGERAASSVPPQEPLHWPDGMLSVRPES